MAHVSAVDGRDGTLDDHRRPIRSSPRVQLTYFHDGDSPILIASNYGGSRHPHWYHNLIAHPECKFGDDAFVAREITDPTEYDRLYALAEHVYAGYGDYRTATARFDRHIPVFRLEPSHE